MASDEVTIEIVRDTCGRCGQAREVIFDLTRGKNTCGVTEACRDPKRCAAEMVRLYLGTSPASPTNARVAANAAWGKQRDEIRARNAAAAAADIWAKKSDAEILEDVRRGTEHAWKAYIGGWDR